MVNSEAITKATAAKVSASERAFSLMKLRFSFSPAMIAAGVELF